MGSCISTPVEGSALNDRQSPLVLSGTSSAVPNGHLSAKSCRLVARCSIWSRPAGRWRRSPTSSACRTRRSTTGGRQDRIDRGVRPGVTTVESAELAAARKRIRELETELAVMTPSERAVEGAVRPKRRWEVVAQIVSEDLPDRGYLPRRRRVRVGVLHVAQAQAVGPGRAPRHARPR